MSVPTGVPEALQGLLEARHIDEVLFPLKSGKEATVYVTRKNGGDAPRLLAAKVYRDLQHRSFRRDGIYRTGWVVDDERLARAIAGKTRTGREALFGMWVGEEAQMLRRARSAGADVPAVVTATSSVILMEYLGDEEVRAPALAELQLTPEEAEEVFAQVMAGLTALLRANVIHADLSAYNVLCWEGRAVLIDFPQAVDARKNRNAQELLARDVANLCTYFRRQGYECDAERLARELWDAWLRDRL